MEIGADKAGPAADRGPSPVVAVAWILGAIVLTVGLTTISVAYPNHRVAIFEEDRIVEWATTVAFAATGLLGLMIYRRGDRRNLALLAVALIGCLGALDELSFGERLFEFEAPRVLGTKVDSAHDFLLVARTAIYRLAGSYQYLLAAGILVVACAVGWWLLRAALARGWSIGRRDLLILPVAATAAVTLAQMIDVSLDLIPYKMLQELYVEEVLELAAGLLLLGYVWSVRDS